MDLPREDDVRPDCRHLHHGEGEEQGKLKKLDIFGPTIPGSVSSSDIVAANSSTEMNVQIHVLDDGFSDADIDELLEDSYDSIDELLTD